MSCARCGIGGINAGLEPLEGTGLSFCKCCAEVVRGLAAFLFAKKETSEEILRHISLRYSSPATQPEDSLST